MKRRMISLLLVLALLLACLPVMAFALAAENITVSEAVYHPNGSLASIKTKFNWGSGSASVTGARLILMSKRLNGSQTSGDSLYDSDFSDVGKYGIYQADNFDSFAEAQNEDNSNHTFGFITYSGETSIAQGSKGNTITLNIAENDIPMNTNATYYVYLWVTYRGAFYPDNLICAIQVKDGKLLYSAGDSSGGLRNYYNPIMFKEVDNEDSTETPPSHTCVKSGWKWDENNHWRWICTTEGCQNYHVQTDRNAHVYSDGYDAACNTCGYTRTPPAEHPETGDITHIPMWTALFLGGIALLWMQLAQRKRQQY